jgi:RNA polymerase sigma factor (sigma-70 family)
MARSRSVPGIPAKWFRYIKRCAVGYAVGVFSREDAEQTAWEAFLRAEAHYVAGKGVFEHYAKAAIRNALQNARVAEQRHSDIPADPSDAGGAEIPTPPWAAEGEALGEIDAAERERAVSSWTDSLPAGLSSIFRGLYGADMSQRELAAVTGVSQSAVSQRNRKLLLRGEEALAALAAADVLMGTGE